MNYNILAMALLIGIVAGPHNINMDEFEEVIQVPDIKLIYPEPEPDIMPVSDYIRPYNITKVRSVWRAINGTSYIDPNHEVVQWYARNTILNETGLYYLDGKMVLPQYFADTNYENDDHWMNADYYLSHNLSGDCEDYAIGIASILEAKDIPNMIVAVKDNTGYFHIYLQYNYNDEYYTADFTHPRYMLREYNSKQAVMKVWMFNIDTDYSTYVENWAAIS